MNSTSTEQLRCVVQGEEKLPAEIGGGGAVCSAITRASAPVLQRGGVAPGTVSVSVEVISPYRISATPSVGGRTLPEQHVGISDRPLNARALDMLGQAIAAELSKLAQQ